MKHHILPPLPWKYYENAINKFDPNEYDFILFTDNYVEVINNMDTSKFLYFDESSELDDLFLMSQCDAFIMSNSTLSWWGAWLGKEKKKIIIPPIWFGIAGPTDLKDLIPEKWAKPSEISFLNPYKIFD